jgi:TolB-like protein
VAVIDFAVQSENPSYKYLGKGFAEFAAIELARSRDVLLIEREKRNKALEELAFSLSDIADESKQLEVGQFLSAQYLVLQRLFALSARGRRLGADAALGRGSG